VQNECDIDKQILPPTRESCAASLPITKLAGRIRERRCSENKEIGDIKDKLRETLKQWL